MTALLEVTGLGKRFGGFVALESIDLEVQQGERLGLIGPNGSGKSTLVNCICCTLHNETGRVRSCAASPSRPSPAKLTLPTSLCRVPQMQLTNVDLPEPFGPIRPTRSPC